MSYFFKFAIVSKLDPVITTGFFKLSLPSCQWQRTCNKCKWLLFDHAEQQINSFRTILDISICSKWMFFSQQIKNVFFQMNPFLQNLNLQNYIYTFKYKLFHFFQKWRNELLQWNPQKWDNITSVRIDPETVWVPDILLHNK